MRSINEGLKVIKKNGTYAASVSQQLGNVLQTRDAAASQLP